MAGLKSQILALCDGVQRDLKLSGLPTDGSASDGTEYESLKQMWTAKLGLGSKVGKHGLSGQSLASWYEKAYDYWEEEGNCRADEDGVLGGFGHISPIDVAGSAAFLDELRELRPQMGSGRAADCGAGIGRVAKHLLLGRYDFVDIVEQSPRLIGAAPKYIGRERDRVECICVGMQDFAPEPDSYDLIWIQWVVGHLHDIDLLKFINRCRVALKTGGVIVLKDNTSNEGAFVVDCEDSSLTRSLGYFRSLFNQGGIKVVHQKLQPGFPDSIFPVHIFALV